MMTRRDKKEAALKRGADELMNLAEHVLIADSRALMRVRAAYKTFCLGAYGAIESGWRRRPWLFSMLL